MDVERPTARGAAERSKLSARLDPDSNDWKAMIVTFASAGVKA
jgi:hypothetical protein